MKIKTILAGITLVGLFVAAKSDRPAYRIFNIKGHAADYGDLLKAARNADVVFFGESHTDPICHWLELQLTKDLYEEKNGKLIIGAEMFERDNQLLLNESGKGILKRKPNSGPTTKPIMHLSWILLLKKG
jgi:uncharacterized iron-regulated protein